MLIQKLQDDQIASLKSGDKVRLTVLRFVISQIKNKEIEKKSELNDEETLVVLKKFAKELNESITAFTKGNRPELVDENKKQLEIISTYLPKEISDGELAAEMDKILAENKALIDDNPKAVIGVVMGRLKTKADPARIMPMLRSKINLG
ncbi:MAG: GatB/YqeY domain-containing protein [Patescibacteria group bacterium]